MKRFISLLIILMAMTSTCLAMTFSQPVKLGRVSDYREANEGYEIVGATDNSGSIKKPTSKIAAKYTYVNGIAKFGIDDDAIYFHYNNARNYGGKDLNNTFPFTSAYGCDFTQIKTDSDVTLYMVHERDYDIRGEKYILLGRRKDGVFVKYFDTMDLTQIYFDKPKTFREIPYYAKWHCIGNTIVVEYGRLNSTSSEGEFRFKWDEAAQWFGVEQVVY